MAPFVELLLVSVLGAMVGSFLNVCIYRLPLEKSLLWPSSRCGWCQQPIRWYDNIPLLSYWRLRGRCRACGQPFAIRYFLIELLTAASFAGLFYLEVIQNVHGLSRAILEHHHYEIGSLVVTGYELGLRVIFAYHAILVCFLLVAAMCDIDHQAIPLSVTLWGTATGLVGSVLFPWPWPYTPMEALPVPLSFRGMTLSGAANWWLPSQGPRQGIYAWPVWGPLPKWLQPGGNWQTGLATGVAGLLAGTLVLRAVRLFFGIGMGAEYTEPADPEAESVGAWPGRRWLSWVQRVGGRALGLGDADLMMMAGSFLGWQQVTTAFLIGVFPGLLFGLAQVCLRRGNTLPFGPSLALGVVITFLGWTWIGAEYQPFFFNGVLVVAVAIFGCVGMLVAAYILRMVRMMRR